MALLAPFLILPIIELVVFVLVCLLLGFWSAIGLLLAGTLAGALLLRFHGIAAFHRIQRRAGEHPSDHQLLDGLWLTVAAFFLLIPGFVTDLLALALVVPPLRRALARPLLGRLRAYAARTPPRQTPSEPPVAPFEPTGIPPGPVIDVEFEDLPPEPSSRP